MVAGNFFFHLFFGSFLTLLLNIVFLGICIFLAGRIMNMKENNAKNAIQATLVAFVIGLIAIIFRLIDFWIIIIIEFFAVLWTIKKIYKTDYYNALVLLVLATVIFTVIVWLVSAGGFVLY